MNAVIFSNCGSEVNEIVAVTAGNVPETGAVTVSVEATTAVRYTLNVAVPALLEAVSVPARPVPPIVKEQVPVYRLESSFLKVAVMVNEKLTVGEELEVARLIECT